MFKKMMVVGALFLFTNVSSTPISIAEMNVDLSSLSFDLRFSGLPSINTDPISPYSGVLAENKYDYAIDNLYGNGNIFASVSGSYASSIVSDKLILNQAIATSLSDGSYSRSESQFSNIFLVNNLLSLTVSLDYDGFIFTKIDKPNEYAWGNCLGYLRIRDLHQSTYSPIYPANGKAKVSLNYYGPYSGPIFLDFESHVFASVYVPEPQMYIFLLFGICMLLIKRLLTVKLRNSSAFA